MKAVVLLSGGMDSAVCASIAKKEGFTVYALHSNYHQRTSKKELACAKKLARFFHAEDFKVITLDFLKEIGGSGLIDTAIELPTTEPDTKTETEINMDMDMETEPEIKTEPQDIPPSYVPFRNSILLSLATAWAEVISADSLFYGANFIDFSGYPDCRPQYFKAFQKLIDSGTKDDTHIVLRTPLAELSKADIVKTGLQLNTPFELTWSCYTQSKKACGICDSCRLRLEGFAKNNAHDPIQYEK